MFGFDVKINMTSFYLIWVGPARRTSPSANVLRPRVVVPPVEIWFIRYLWKITTPFGR